MFRNTTKDNDGKKTASTRNPRCVENHDAQKIGNLKQTKGTLLMQGYKGQGRSAQSSKITQVLVCISAQQKRASLLQANGAHLVKERKI